MRFGFLCQCEVVYEIELLFSAGAKISPYVRGSSCQIELCRVSRSSSDIVRCML